VGGQGSDPERRTVMPPPRERRRKVKALSPQQESDRALDVLCEMFEWDRSTIYSSHNRKDPTKPFVFKARTKREWKKNEILMREALGQPPVWSWALIHSTDDIGSGIRQPTKRRRRNSSRIHGPLLGQGPELPNWDLIKRDSPDPGSPILAKIKQLQAVKKHRRRRKS
jgi:hypothetical protein